MFYIGIDVGGMSIKGGIMSQSGNLIHKFSVPTASGYDASHSISADVKSCIDGLLAQSGVAVSDIAGIGIGHPGSIDSERGVIRYSNNISLTDVHMVEELQRDFDLPIYLDNDANCAALGEYVYGAGKGYRDVIFVTLGTGVGTGIIINGKLFEGRAGAGAEAGHMVIRQDGEACNCGRNGCWERYASASGLIRQTQEQMDADPASAMHAIAAQSGGVNGMTAFCAARAGDESGRKVVDRYISYIAEGILNLVNIFRPDAILIGGGVSHEGTFLTDPIQRQVDRFNFGAQFNPPTVIKAASLGNDAGILGAAALVTQKH